MTGLVLLVRRSLAQHKLSTAVTVLAAALACGLVMSVFAITNQTREAFTSADRSLVMGSPSYEECPGMATAIGSPINALPLTQSMHLDLDAMAEFYCSAFDLHRGTREQFEDGGGGDRSEQSQALDLRPGEVRKLKIVAGKEGMPLSLRAD